MCRTRVLAAIFTLVVVVAAHAADGLVSVKSAYDAKTSMDRLESIVTERGLTVFARIDHAAGAATTGRTLRPTELLIFGNPQGGTPFMECAQTVGIDLPLKALVWEDAAGQAWIGYTDPAYLATRHGAADCPVVATLQKVLSGLVDAAARDADDGQ
ncbi:MAG: DUF302 domain-containing protein [Vicinamibacterales bacterium]|nr:DUF302 domain-containing protein [Vicinamibacterales bacterium]